MFVAITTSAALAVASLQRGIVMDNGHGPKTFRQAIPFVRYSRDASDGRLVLEHEAAEVVTDGATFLGLRRWATMTKVERLRHDTWVEKIHDAYVQWQMETPTIRRLVQRRLSDLVHIDRATILQALDESIKLTWEARDRLEEAISGAFTQLDAAPHEDPDDEIADIVGEVWSGIAAPEPPVRFAIPEEQVDRLRARARLLPKTLQQCVIAIVDALDPFTLTEREMTEASLGA